jgi:1-acyl-sn-glycerol-3-phosphate acyltransferase
LLRSFVTSVLRFALRLFFRRVEVVGRERVPRTGAVLFVLNHPNGLVDPCFLLCHAPRRVSFLAKSPLFTMPVIGYFVRALDSIPVYRRQDEGADPARNRETFGLSAELLRRGGTIAICPEGVSHNEPQLQPLKTGAARIALGAASSAGDGLDLKVVPAGLYYTAKTAFRSGALLYFGEPISVDAVALDEAGEPPREAVRELSDRLAGALRAVTLNADRHEALQMVARAERIFSAGDEADEGGELSLERELRRRRLFVEAYAYLREHAAERLERLEQRIRLYEQELEEAGIRDPRQLSPESVSRYARVGRLLPRVALFALLLPVAATGAFVHYPAYWLAGYLGTKFSNNYEDVLSTFKIAAALLLLPLTWLGLAALLYALAGWTGALAALVVAPLAGYAALRTREELGRFVAGVRVARFFVTERRFFRRLLEERRAIRREILALGEVAERAGALSAA